MIYADNASTTKMSKTALNAMLPYLDNIYGNPSSLHSVGQIAAEALAEARNTVAECLGTEAKNVIFTSGGSESDNQAIVSAAKLGLKNNKKHIISTAFEHHAVLHTLKKLESEGFEVTYLPINDNGIVRPEQVEAAIRPDTCLCTVMYANNEIGTVQPIKEIGRICREKKVLFHTDAVQAAGHIKISVEQDNIDMLSISAHKFGGPKGVGALYFKKGVRLLSLIEGGDQERGKRAGTENVASIVAMAAAFKEACDNMEKNNEKIIALREKLIEGIGKIPHSLLNGDRYERLPGNINFCFEGIEGESLILLLDEKGIYASSGSACASGSLDPSHVLLALGRPHEIAHGSLRLSINEDLTEADADKIISDVTEVVTYLRSISPIWRDMVEGKKEFVIK